MGKQALLLTDKLWTCGGCGKQEKSPMPPRMPREGELAGWIGVSWVVTTHGGQGRLERAVWFCSLPCLSRDAILDGLRDKPAQE